jgi:exopolysaccharide biosynthesis polyprenyl glycosylphosphotransferase
MKKADIIINLILVPVDFILLWAASLSAYYLRFSDTVVSWRPVFFELPILDYLYLTLQVSILGMFIFAILGFYSMHNKKLVKELPKIFMGVSFLVVVLILSIFLQRELFSSRFIIILGWALAILYLFISRVLIVFVRNYFFQKGHGLSKVIILGPSAARQIIVDEYKNNPRLGFKVLETCHDLATLESSEKLQALINNKKVDYIIQTDSTISKDQALDLLTYCQENHVSLKYVANLFQAQSLHLNLGSVAGLPLVEIQSTPLEGWGKVAKRIFDFILANLALIVLSPLFIIIALLIKFTSPGPVFVSLDRVGVKGKMFKLYKFRSMIKDAHILKADMMKFNQRADGPLFKMKNDPRITKIGRFLRKTSLDELPQLFNAFIGNMSLVGPRPHEPEEVSKYQRGYKKLLSIKPGVTGMAQVSGRSNLLFTEEAKLDIFYIENWSLLLDLVILFKTPFIIINREVD